MVREGLRGKKGKEIGKRWAFDREAEAGTIMVRGHGSIGAAALIRL